VQDQNKSLISGTIGAFRSGRAAESRIPGTVDCRPCPPRTKQSPAQDTRRNGDRDGEREEDRDKGNAGTEAGAGAVTRIRWQ
jgi:hypothetical protein